MFENWSSVLSYKILILFAGFEGDLDTERKSLVVVGHLNLALCHLKLQEYIEARDQCDKALKLNPDNEKGLFRRLVSEHIICACNEGLKRVLLWCRGTAVAQWLRCRATNRKVDGSIPAGVSGFFIDIKFFQSHYGPGVDSASNRNAYQEYFLGVKVAGA